MANTLTKFPRHLSTSSLLPPTSTQPTSCAPPSPLHHLPPLCTQLSSLHHRLLSAIAIAASPPLPLVCHHHPFLSTRSSRCSDGHARHPSPAHYLIVVGCHCVVLSLAAARATGTSTSCTAIQPERWWLNLLGKAALCNFCYILLFTFHFQNT
jgi:hypothetical protein